MLAHSQKQKETKQVTFTCSKATTETLEKGVKSVHTFSSVSIVDFE